MRHVSVFLGSAFLLAGAFFGCGTESSALVITGSGEPRDAASPPRPVVVEDAGTSDAEPPTPTGKLRWLKTASGPGALVAFTSIAIDALGNVLVAGTAAGLDASTDIAFGDGKVLTVAGANVQEAFVARYDALGVCQWVTLVGGAGEESLYRVAFSPTGEAIAVGETVSASAPVIVEGVSVAKPSNATSNDILVVKLDAAGKRVWHKIFGGPGEDTAAALAVNVDGDIAIGGVAQRVAAADVVAFPPRSLTNPTSPAKVAFTALLDKDGLGKWAWAYPPGAGATATDRSGVRGLAFDSAGDLLAAGGFDRRIDLRSGQTGSTLVFTVLGAGFDGFVAKLSAADGRTTWAQRIAGAADDTARDVTTDGARNVYVAGNYTGAMSIGSSALPVLGGIDAYVAKLDPAGVILWARGYGASDLQSADTVAVDPWNNIVVSGVQEGPISWGGATSTGGGNQDGFVVKLDALGQRGLWAYGVGSVASDLVAQAAIAPQTGRVAVTGVLTDSAVLAGQAVPFPDGGALALPFVMVLDP